jgi:copper homeostasis protein
VRYIIEIATTDFTTTKSAVEGGADRIELCAALSEGGITPSYGLIKQCRKSFDVALFPIIRPRAGDFLYTAEEFELMRKDILLCKESGCDGVVIGLLNRDGSIDLLRTAQLVDLAYPLEVTFHRAFDRCKEPLKALEQLIEIGCQRILTSGQMPTAPEGVDLIAELIQQADDRIIIMPGSGVREENIKMIADKTGAVEFHSSLKGQKDSAMEFIHPSFKETKNTAIDPAAVRSLRSALH